MLTSYGIKKDLKERFLNLDTFVIGPFLIALGASGIIGVQYFLSILSVGLITAGLYMVLYNRVAKLRDEKKAVEG
jgi:hypothetical protein